MFKVKVFKVFVLLSLSSCPALAKDILSIEFPKFDQTILVDVENASCRTNGENALLVETEAPGTHYRLACSLPSTDKTNDFATHIRVIEDFHYPATILEKIQASPYEELKKIGKKAIKSKKRSWGREYWWETPMRGSEATTYLCPKKKNFCFEVVHGGIEHFEFDLKSGGFKKANKPSETSGEKPPG